MKNLTKEDIIKVSNMAMVTKDDPRIHITEPGTKYHVFLALLAKEAVVNRVIELGCYRGETSKQIGIMCPNAEIWTIDVNPDAKRIIETEEPIVPNVKAFTCHAEYFISTNQYDGKPIDLLFIDSNHDYSHTMGNFNCWKGLVRPRGLIVFDDWTLDSEMVKVRDDLINNKTNEPFDYDIVEVNQVHATGLAVMIKH